MKSIEDVNHTGGKFALSVTLTRGLLKTEGYPKTFKIQKGPLNCDFAKALYLSKCKVCGEVPYIGKGKPKFC